MLEIDLIFNKESGKVELSPPVDEWLRDFADLIRYFTEQISLVACFSANEIGSARDNGKIKIFDH